MNTQMNGLKNGKHVPSARTADHRQLNGRWTGEGIMNTNSEMTGFDADTIFAQDLEVVNRILSEELGESVWVGLSESDGKHAVGRIDGNAKQQTAQLNFLVCVGGTGTKVATQLKARFMESIGQVPRNVVMLSLDGANDPVAVRESRNGAIVELEWGNERHQLDSVPVANILKYLDQHPEIAERFGREMLLKMRGYIVDGAAGERPQGAVTIVWNTAHVLGLVSNALRRLAERTKDLQQVMDGNVVLRVYVVSSIAGGMGAGALVDLAYLLREELQKLGTLGESSSIHAMLLLPGAFYGIEDQRKQANAYATLREINALMLGDASFSSGYPNGRRIDSALPPFKDVALYDGVNEHGRTWRSQDEILALMAETLWLLTSSEVGSQEINLKINEAGVLSDVSAGGYATCATTSGAVVLRFPARTASVWCAVYHAEKMVDVLLSAPDPNEDAAGYGVTVSDLASLRDRFLSNEDGLPHQVRLAAPAALMDMPIDELPGQTRNLFENFMQRRLYNDIFVQMKERMEGYVEALIGSMERQQAALLETGRPLVALKWLATNRAVLNSLLASAGTEQNRLGQIAEQQQVALESASVGLERAGSGIAVYLPVIVRAQARSAVSVYLDEGTALARVRMAQRVEEMCVEVIYRVADWVQQNQRKLEVVTARLQQTREWLSAHQVALGRRSSGRSEISLLDSNLVGEFYRSYAGNPRVAAQLALGQSRGLLEWAVQKPEWIGLLLVQTALSSFDKVARLSVEDVMRLRFPERSSAQWVTMFQALAAGSWNLDRALLRSGGAQLARILTIGVPDESKSIFQDCGHGLVNTHDSERVVVLLTVYGASFDALKSFAQWETAYRIQSSKRPVHVLPYFLRNGDQATRVFGLGLAFDLIQMTGTWYNYRPEDPLADKVRLGQGLESALRGLAVNPAVQEQVMRRLETQIAAQGIDAAARRIQAWIERGGANGDETLKRLRMAAREYCETELGVELQSRSERSAVTSNSR
ncbi:MAG: tubulin-like doman-containing protein [Caldilinea sp.]